MKGTHSQHALFLMGLLSATSLHAQVQNVMNLSLTMQFQGNMTTNGAIVKSDSPVSKKFGTKELLSLLAMDEYAAGYYNEPNFPKDAKLVFIVTDSGGDFQVVDTNNGTLANVSSILSANTSPGGPLVSGKQNTSVSSSSGNALAAPTVKTVNFLTIAFDDTAINGGGNMAFTISGIDENITTDSKPNTNGMYSESQTDTVKNFLGSGTDSNGNPFIMTGFSSASGEGKLSVGVQ